MPNPIAHPAVSIPFTKVGLVFSALVIGSITPDFGYLVHLVSFQISNFSHTALGLILFDLPAGLILLWLFHTILKWPMLSLLPESLQRRLIKHAQGFSFGPRKRFGLLLLSLLVGSLTHVIWDSFTHDYGLTVEQFALLRIPIGSMPLYTILQYLSSILGVGILLYWFIRWLPTASQSDQLPAHFPRVIRNTFFSFNAISLVVVEGAIIYSRVMTGLHFSREHFLMDSTTISGAFIILFFVGIYCLAWMMLFSKTIHHIN